MKRLELKQIIKEEVKRVVKENAQAGIPPASEVLSMLAAPELKKYMEQLADMLEDSQYMAIKKLYDGLYMELKKYE